MSKSKDLAPKADKAEKKRKRQDESEDVPKKSKKSKKTERDQGPPAADLPVVDETKAAKKAKNEEKKKRKNERKEKEVVGAGKENGDVKESADMVPLDNDTPMPDATDEKKSKKDKKDKKDKKEKKVKKEKKSKETLDAGAAEAKNGVSEGDAPTANGEEAGVKLSKEEEEKKKKAKKEKKEKKEKKKSKKDDDTTAESEPAAETNGDAPADSESPEAGAQDEVEEAAEPGKKGRFIVFVGNLPYSATKESISEHFAKLHPTDIRLRTYKGSEKFMGTCFIEFDRFDRMETCLKKYHHSVFPDGKKKEGRKINVELSAGGGGNSESRKSKIVAKNDKLHDERARDREKRAELEMKQNERKEKKERKGKKDEATEEAEPDNGGIHPARLAMIAAPARPTHRQRY